MNQSTLLKIKRHLLGLLKAMEEQDEGEINIDGKMVYYDNRGNIVHMKITKNIDYLE